MANSRFNPEYFNEYKLYLTALGQDNSKTRNLLIRNLGMAINDELTPRQRQVIKMYYINQMKMSDIASVLGINTSTVSRTMKRARNSLRRCLKYGAKELLSDCVSSPCENHSYRC